MNTNSVQDNLIGEQDDKNLVQNNPSQIMEGLKNFFNKPQEERQKEIQKFSQDFKKSNPTSPFDTSGLTADKGSISSRYRSLEGKTPGGLSGAYNTQGDLEITGALNQGWGESIGNTIKGFSKLAVAGGLDWFASGYDASGVYDMAVGNADAHVGNWLTDITNEMREDAMNDNPIYQSGSMWSKGYWFNQLQNIGYSAGLAGGAIVEQAVLAALTGGAGNVATMGLKARNITNLGRAGLTGMRAGLGEAYINGLETGREVKEKYIRLGYTEEQANDKASEAATLGFRLEAGPLALLNMFQYALIFGKAGGVTSKTVAPQFGVSNTLEGALEGVIPKNKIAKLATTMGVEAAEEVYQDGVSNYAQGEDFWQADLIDSAIGGALGGLVLGGMGSATKAVYNRLNGGTESQREYDDTVEKFIQDSEKLTLTRLQERERLTKEYQKAQKAYEANKTPENEKKLANVTAQVKNAQYNAHLAATMQSLKYDYLKGEGIDYTTAFDAHIENMQNEVDAIDSNDTEKLKAMGLIDEKGNEVQKDILAETKKKQLENIKDSQDIQAKLHATLENITSDFDTAREIAGLSFRYDKNRQEAKRLQSEIDFIKQQNKYYQELSEQGKNLYDLETRQTAFDILNDLEQSQAHREAISELGYNYTKEELEAINLISDNQFVSGITSIEAYNKEASRLAKEIAEAKKPSNIKNKVQARIEQQVALANTQKQLVKAIKDAEKAGTLNEKIVNKAEKKADEIKKDEVLGAIDKKYKPSPKKEEIIESSKDETPAVKETFETLEKKNEGGVSLGSMLSSGELTSNDDMFFSPREFDNNVSDADRQKLEDLARSINQDLDRDLGREATLEDFLKHYIEQSTFDRVDKSFNGLVYMFSLTGRDVGNPTDVYNKIFNREDTSLDILDAYLSPEQVNTEVVQVQNTATQVLTKTPVYDPKNRPTPKLDNDDKSRTNDPTPKLAHIGSAYREVRGPRGNVYKVPVEELVDNGFGNNYILIPEYNKDGTQFTVEVLQGEEANNYKVTVWDYNEVEDRLVPRTVSFGSLGLVPGTPEYTASVPMVVVDSDGNRVAHLHDAYWYNSRNVQHNATQSLEQVAEEGMQRVYNIRESVMAGNNVIQVQGKSFGSIFRRNLMEGPNNGNISINEATGDSTLAISTEFDKLSNASETFTNSMDIINGGDVTLGWIYDIRHVHTKEDGTKQYIALPVNSNEVSGPNAQLLGDVAYNNMKFAILSSILLNAEKHGKKDVALNFEKTFGLTVSKAQEIRDKIKSSTGVNKIDVQFELNNYLRMYMPVYNSHGEFLAALEDTSTREDGSPRIPNVTMALIDPTSGIFKMAFRNGQPIARDERGYDLIEGIDLQGGKTPIGITMKFLDYFVGGDTGALRQVQHNASRKQLGVKSNFIQIDSQGNVSDYVGRDGNSSYDSYLKDTFTTNVKSFPVKDKEGNTVWITDVQPMVYYQSVENTPKSLNPTEQEELANTDTTLQAQDTPAVKELENIVDELPQDLAELIGDDLYILGNLDADNIDYDATFNSRRNFTEEESDAFNNIEIKKISSLNPIEQRQLEGSLFNSILKDLTLEGNKINLTHLSELIKNSVINYLLPQIREYNNKVRGLEASIASGRLNPAQIKQVEGIVNKYKQLINKLNTVHTEQEKLNGFGENKGTLVTKFERLFSEELQDSIYAEHQEDITIDDNGEVENSYSQSSLERDAKLSFSGKMRVFFSGIERRNPQDNTPRKNFTGMTDYVDIDTTMLELLSLTTELPSSLADLKNILQQNPNNTIHLQLLDKLNNADESVTNEILYKMIQSRLDMHMIIYSASPSTEETAGAYKLQRLDANSSNADVVMKMEWRNNFVNSDLVETKNDLRVLNKEKIKALKASVDKMLKVEDFSTQEVFDETKRILNELGVHVNDNTIQYHLQRGKELYGAAGIIGALTRNLNTAITKEGDINVEEKGNNPFDNASGATKNIIDTEISLNGSRISKSFRVGGKTLQGTIQKMMSYDIVNQILDTESETHKALKELPYSKRNFVLDLIANDEKFRANYGLSFTSLEALKREGQKVFDDRKVNKLGDIDATLFQLGMFQNTTATIDYVNPNYPGLKFRMTQMFNPTLSDKDQMILYNTAVLDLNYKDFDINSNNIQLSEEGLRFIANQIFDNEFDRIVFTNQNPVNVKDYTGAAKSFLSIPAFNNIEIEEKGNRVKLVDLINKASNVSDYDFEALRKKAYPQVLEVIKSTILAETNKKFRVENGTIQGEWVDNNFVVRNKSGAVVIEHLDGLYLKSKVAGNDSLTGGQRASIAAMDFVINNLLHQATVYQLVAGDMAMYGKGLGKFTNKETGVVDYVKLSKAIGENITKRMAMMIAPGNILANSKGDNYIQIFLNDSVESTSTAREFIEQSQGSVSETNARLLDELNNVNNSLNNLHKSKRQSEDFQKRLDELQDQKENIIKQLKRENPDIAGYFEIEGTDAQEYTTWKEHMDILFRQGRLTTEQKAVLQSAYNKLVKGEDLNTQELKLVMNPIKPVYAGNHIDKNKEGQPIVNRTVYIKSSSFPLLPQLTKGLELDKMRLHMEKLQSSTGKNVRMSYQTANKIGALNTKLTVQDLYNSSFEELYSEDGTKGKLSESILTLNRENFKIQQDTPYKTEKFLNKNSEDMVTMGSQMWKIILGNGINTINKPLFPNLFSKSLLNEFNTILGGDVISSGNYITGIDLDRIKFLAEQKYFDLQQKQLYSELKLDNEGNSPDPNATMEALQDLLVREVTTRQYPDNMIDVLDLVENERGEKEFKLPVWMAPSSDKFESLLQAIITNRLIKIKLPGNQHISGSSEGFRKTDVQSLDDLSKEVKSQIVWVDPNFSGDLKATHFSGRDENGNKILKSSEVLLQSKFRVEKRDENGKKYTELIDLTDPKYSTRNEKGELILNKDMIDSELLDMFSFRIPTSSHQSGAMLRVVGFLPEASGDLLVVPKEHTQQIGEDFDIDKRNLYKSNYTVNSKTGKIKKLSYRNIVNEESLEKDEILLESYLGSVNGDMFGLQEALENEQTKDRKKQIQMLENVMIDIYKSVYLSPFDEVQNRINKILSFDNATNTANLIYDRKNSGQDETYFTLLSDAYQKAQMKLGADGKTGIGAHSNAVTLQAQMERAKNKVVVQQAYSEGDAVVYRPSEVVIGNFVSDGTLGKSNTLDGTRSIGDVHTENQNSATDNIKAQIMGKRNENAYTMNVLIQLTYRGFDMVPFTRVPGVDKVQVSSLFIAQPILERYVQLKEASKSIIADFSSKGEDKILNKLIEEFGGEGATSKYLLSVNPMTKETTIVYNNESEYHEASAKMTGDVLYDNLLPGLASPDIQMAVLKKFLDLSKEAAALNNYQRLINLNSSGLGLSFFNVLDRIEKYNNIRLAPDNQFENIDNLIGDREDENLTVGTTEGTVLDKSVNTAFNIMSRLYPYNNDVLSDTIDNILDVDKTTVMTDNRKMAAKYEIMGGFRDFIYSSNLGLFSGDINAERQRLFFDNLKTKKKSLASYLQSLKNGKDKNHRALMYSNELLNSFVFDGISYTGAPSIIKHQADSNTNIDKVTKYTAFLELIQDDTTKLPDFNGEEMTPRKLAQDLASYAFLANNENGAIGFRDFINMKYLDMIGFSDNVRALANLNDNSQLDVSMSNFKTQFMQHNPEYAQLIDLESIDINEFKDLNPEAEALQKSLKNPTGTNKRRLFNVLEYFNVDKDSEIKSEYVAIRNPSINKSSKTYDLFKYDTRTGLYVKIPVLGTFGYNEYNPKVNVQSSTIYPNIPTSYNGIVSNKYASLTQSPVAQSDRVINDNLFTELYGQEPTVESLLNSISDNTLNEFSGLAKVLKNHTRPDTKVVLTDKVRGASYNPSDNIIYLNTSFMSNVKLKPGETVENVMQEMVLEEIIHSMTIDLLSRHIDPKSGDINMEVPSDAPQAVKEIVDAFKVAKETYPSDYYTQNIGEFVAGALVSKAFQDKLSNIRVARNMSLLDRLKQAIVKGFKYLVGEAFTENLENNILTLIKSRDYDTNVLQQKKDGLSKSKQTDTKAEKLVQRSATPSVGVTDLKDIKHIPVAKASNYNEDNMARVLDRFKKGEPLVASNLDERKNYPHEYLYMKGINNYVLSITPKGMSPVNLVQSVDLPNGQKMIQLKPEYIERPKAPVVDNVSTDRVRFEEEPTSGYRNRTVKNASADATIAIAVDFNSAGEKLTKNSVNQQGKKYIPINANNLEVTQERVDKIVEELNSVGAKTLNIAGNGIYTMKGKYTQQQIDDFTYELLKQVLESPNLKVKIESIRSGGQTGFDEAGTKAGIRLGLPTLTLAPKGWTFRNENGRDISDETQFKARFEGVSEDTNTTNQSEVDNLISLIYKYSEIDNLELAEIKEIFTNPTNDSNKEDFEDYKKLFYAIDNLHKEMESNTSSVIESFKPGVSLRVKGLSEKDKNIIVTAFKNKSLGIPRLNEHFFGGNISTLGDFENIEDSLIALSESLSMDLFNEVYETLRDNPKYDLELVLEELGYIEYIDKNQLDLFAQPEVTITPSTDVNQPFSLGGLDFTSGGEGYDSPRNFKLPEIKNC